MATLYIKEYTHICRDKNGNVIQAGLEDGGSTTSQTVTTSGTSAQSAAFQSDTTFVRIVSTGIEHLEFGANPTATTNSATKIEADTPEFFGVAGGQKVAAINGT